MGVGNLVTKGSKIRLLVWTILALLSWAPTANASQVIMCWAQNVEHDDIYNRLNPPHPELGPHITQSIVMTMYLDERSLKRPRHDGFVGYMIVSNPNLFQIEGGFSKKMPLYINEPLRQYPGMEASFETQASRGAYRVDLPEYVLDRHQEKFQAMLRFNNTTSAGSKSQMGECVSLVVSLPVEN